MKQRWPLPFYAALLLSAPAVCKAAAVTPAALPAGQGSLMQVIGALANFKHFRATATGLDAIVAPFCKKVHSNVDKLSTSYKYTCAPASGLLAATISTLHPPGEENYVSVMSVDFSMDEFGAARKLVQKQLGKPNETLPDYISWRFTTDKKLNKHGSPIASVSREKADKTASFSLALEVGP